MGLPASPLVFTPNPFEVPVWTRLLKASCAIQYRKQGKYHVILVKVNCATLYVHTRQSFASLCASLNMSRANLAAVIFTAFLANLATTSSYRLHHIWQLSRLEKPKDGNPAYPVWPDMFQQSFQESFYYPVLGTHKTNGTYYYDFANRRYRIDRANGRYDRYCGLNGEKAFVDTPCTQLVVEGMRWLIYPEKQECCQCCTSEQGCGVLFPTWMNNATFIGMVC